MAKRLGVLTSGGDCSGLNAAIRAVVHTAIGCYGYEVYGIRRGTSGLIRRPIEAIPLNLKNCDSSLLRTAGTFLGTTNKDDPFNFPDENGNRTNRSEDFIAGYKELGLDALIGIGGDGSIALLRRLAQQGQIPFVAIPKTIDNDIAHTERAIGYSSVLSVVVEALDRLQSTAASHERIMVLEVMGRDAGHIALSAGIAGGADAILIPEIPYCLHALTRKIQETWARGQEHFIIIVSEAVKTVDGDHLTITYPDNRVRYSGIGQYLGQRTSQLTNRETRFSVLGHTQRGSIPCPWDRVLASAFGKYAVDLVAQGCFDHMVAWQGDKVCHVPIAQVVGNFNVVETDGVLVKTAASLGIYLGEIGAS